MLFYFYAHSLVFAVRTTKDSVKWDHMIYSLCSVLMTSPLIIPLIYSIIRRFCASVFLQVQQIGFVTLEPLRCVHTGGCLELYYCNMVEWFWWDSSLIFDVL